MTTEAHPITVDLIRLLLEQAARDGLDEDPQFALALQLISRDVRQWLLPVLYRAFPVRAPGVVSHNGEEDYGDGLRAPYPSPSIAFLLQMISDPAAPPRRHIRHICFLDRDMWPYRRLFREATSVIGDNPECSWDLDSIAIDVPVSRFIFAFRVLTPRLVFEGRSRTMTLTDGITAASLFNRQWPLESMAAGQYLHSLRIRLPESILEASTLRITQSLPENTARISNPDGSVSKQAPPGATLVIQYEQDTTTDGYSSLARLVELVPLLLERATIHRVDVTFELPTSSAPSRAHEQQRELSTFLHAVEAHLTQPGGVPHRVLVQYRDAVVPVPKSVQDYLRMVRLGNTF